MNLEPTQLKDKHGKVVDAAQAVCDVCHGNAFHVVVVDTHNHLICANPICKESYCQGQGKCSAPDLNAGCDRCGVNDRLEGKTVCRQCDGGCACGEDH